MDLTEPQWQILEPLLPKPRVREDGRGRPWRDPRDVLNGILWVLRTGAPWYDLPDRYPPYQTCHRRFQQWVRDGTLEQLLSALAQDLKARGGLDLSECFIDGTFAPAKKGGLPLAKPSEANGARSWQWQTALVFRSPSASRVLRRMKSPW
jgi:transposase